MDPFMYLTVPIPNTNKCTLDFTYIPLDKRYVCRVGLFAFHVRGLVGSRARDQHATTTMEKSYAKASVMFIGRM